MIHNIHILINPEPNREQLALEAYQQRLIEDHRRGKHPYGEKRRACPLCQLGR